MKSFAGIFVNDTKVGKISLKDDDRIRIGSNELEYRPVG